MAGERRTVTMLFADIQGSTAAAEQLDPEEWAEIVNGAFERLIRPVYRYEGTLARLMGDAILAFFGAPIAHEDDAERAVMVGLEMLNAVKPYAREVKDRWGVDVDLRVGINTGLVVVGEVGSDMRVEYSALGDAVNVAARMEQTAAPGTLQVAGDTHRLIQRLFEFEELEPIHAKGKTEPVPAYRVTGIRERPTTTRGILGRAAPLVGRSSELATLRHVVEEVRQGKGQICSVIGEAGVGKSRLAAALKSELAAEDCLGSWPEEEGKADHVQWAEARCLSYNTSVAYAPFIDLFSRIFGIETIDDESTARASVASAVERVFPQDSTPIVSYLCVMLGIDPGEDDAAIIKALPAPELQRRIFAAVIDYIETCSVSKPSVLLVEDLHWSDAVSLALLEELMRATNRTMLAILVLMRPYRDDASWGFHESADRHYSHRYTAVRLRPLDDQASKNMVEGLLGTHGLPGSLERAVLTRSEGNPFFVEEIVRVLLESGTLVEREGEWVVEGDLDQMSISGGLSGLVTARLDRLDDFSKLVAQFASVLGREFEFEELVALADDREHTETALTDLMSRDLLMEQARIPNRTYAFRHALIQEIAYNTILLKSRRSLHGRVAEHLIAEGADPQEVSRHLLQSKQEVRAVPYLVAAGDQATRSMSLADAIRFYDEALTWAADDTDLELTKRIHEGLGAAYTLIPDLTKASASYQQMLELGRARSEPSVQVTALNRLAFTSAALGGDYERATEQLEEARQLAERFGDWMGLAEYHVNSCMIATGRGDMEKAAAHDAETVRLGSAAGSPKLVIGGLIQRVLSLAHATRYDDGLRALEQARQVTAGTTDPLVMSGLSAAEFFYLTREGKLAEAWEQAREAAEIAARIGSSTASVVALQAGFAADLLGDIENALAFYAMSLHLGEESAQLFNAAAAAASMARIYAELGIETEETAGLKAKALQHLETPMGETMASTVFAELGWAAIAGGDLERATEMLSRGLAGSSASKLLEQPRLLLGLATIKVAEGDLAGAGELVSETSDFIEQRRMVYFRPALAATRGSLLLASGRNEEATEVLAEGTQFAEAMGATGLEWRLRAARARALSREGRPEEAARETATARRLVTEQNNRIVDPSVQESFRRAALGRIADLADVASA
jgi:class 3 adenylate cyclase/tetratricopeptide (TPR) repeat protein